ncbi:MAG: hypothetical protein ACRDLV_09375 [Solirubrobacteraceae bacterium]
MTSPVRHPWRLRALVVAAILALALASGLTSRSSGDLSGQISSARSAASALRGQIAADSRQIAATGDGLARARQRLAAIELALGRRTRQLSNTQTSLIAARDRLVDLENRMHAATAALSANLVAGYENGQPSLVSAILSANGFGQLLDQLGFMHRVADQNAAILRATQTTRAEVSSQATQLEALEQRDRRLANQVLTQRNRAAALRSALLREQLVQIRRRQGVAARLSSVNSHLHTLQTRLDAIERRAAEQAVREAATGNANVGGLAIDTGGMVQPPAGAPEAVRQVIAAGNAIATLPYIYGGGHASFHADGYDCSGSVSYALAAAGLVSAPMVSGDFENWGDPGPGRWITIYANADHVWMEVAGWRFDTVALAESGTRWAQGGGEFAGFVVRHPPGL